VQVEARSVADRYYAGLRARDLDAVSATLAPDVRVEVPGATFDGPDPFRGWMQAFFDAFPDIEHVVDRVDAHGSTAEADLRVTGTHTEPLVGPDGSIPPTGRRMELQAHNQMEIRDGRITSVSIAYDPADFLRQLGLGP
jgi:steroid delta-isomerase-like uncharacterized protein